MVCVVTGHYWVVWGHAVRKKEQVVMGNLGQSGLIMMHYQAKKVHTATCIYNLN